MDRAAPTVVIGPVNRGTFGPCIDLVVAEGQEGFVASNVYSIAQAWVEPTLLPVAIRAVDPNGEPSTVVGFAMYGQNLDTGEWWIVRLMIGDAYQGRGFGGAALAALIARLTERHGASEIRLDCRRSNTRAQALYLRHGFQPTGETDGDDDILCWRSPAEAVE